MRKEVISFDPDLNETHKADFLNFCDEVSNNLNGKDSAEQEAVLLEHKQLLVSNYSGGNIHDNIELVFTKSLLLDLLLQDWQLVVGQGQIHIEIEPDSNDIPLNEKKAKTRRRHLLARDNQLRVESVNTFIRGMHKPRLTKKGWHSIFSTMRDGAILREQLEASFVLNTSDDRIDKLNTIIKPYIQFIEPGVICEHTGLVLSDIWRYFRHTWINEYKSLPGRSISILVRDAAAPNHPVIGIAALGSSVAQQTCRDKWIGWDGETFLEKLQQDPSTKRAAWLLRILNNLIDDVYLPDLIDEGIISSSDISSPSISKAKELKDLATKLKSEHIDNPHTAKFKKEVSIHTDWIERAKTNLFKSKRVNALAELLLIKSSFIKAGFIKGSKEELEVVLKDSGFVSSAEKLIRKAKSINVGINMMDIIVCGSIAPYNHILGGKLVCMLLTSPEVVNYYNTKYKNAVSIIASSMSGKPVVREPKLVFLGTTSLYGVGSSQYNRIKIPGSEFSKSNDQTVEYKELGISEGFGSFHFSSETIWLADKLVGKNNGRKRVNSIFGEGANPLLRKLRDALDILRLDSEPILNHRNKRVVYGVALAENFGDVLLGVAKNAKYFFPLSKSEKMSSRISQFWIKRWLHKRIENQDVLNKLSQHTTAHPITHGGKVNLPELEDVDSLFKR